MFKINNKETRRTLTDAGFFNVNFEHNQHVDIKSFTVY